MHREVSPYSGAAGRVLWGAVSVRSLISGMALGFVVLVGDGVFIYAGATVLVTPFTQVVIAFALARFVLNGQFGEWEGSLFSGVGGSWTSVLLVASRYLLLTFIWLLPMMLLGLRVEQTPIGPAMMSGKMGALISLYVFASALTPPLFLIVSVTASDVGELFSRAHWKGLFAGRLVDMASIYAVYSGGVAMALLLCFPVVMITFLPSWKLGVLFLGLAGCFLFGLALNLLGRLCGFFALGDFTLPEAPLEADRMPDPGSPAAGSDFSPAPSGAATDVPARATIPVSSVTHAPRPQTAVSTQSSPSQPAEQPKRTSPALPALLDASERIRPIMQRYLQDPQGALGALEDLHQAFAPHPQVLVALCVCRRRNGEVEESVNLAQSVLPMCFERGHVQLAAQVYKELRREVERLNLNREQLLTIGQAMVKTGDLSGACAAYSTAIGRDPGEIRAVKGLMQVAHCYVNERSKPESALKVYEYLLKHCADSPLADFIRAAHEQCERRLAQTVR